MSAVDHLKGKLIVFEGLDGSGKTTQSKLLYEALKKEGLSVKLFAFPVRTTIIGKLLDQYLFSTDSKIDKHAVHLLFSANRWEMSDTIQTLLDNNITVILDRYNLSGLAYSMANKLDRTWCESTDIGLPSPDIILYIDITTTVGDERIIGEREIYECSDFQLEVAKAYQEIQRNSDNWITINGQDSIENIHANICAHCICKTYVYT
jgi:dTMP kinase